MRCTSAIVALALAGCMKIYPDPELPDVEVTWFEDSCSLEPTGKVAVVLVGLDDPALRAELIVPCSDLQLTFVDVARVRFTLEASLRDPGGHMLGHSESEIDLRDGLDEQTWLFLDMSPANVSVAWSFDQTSCESLGADTVSVRFVPDDALPPITRDLPCEVTAFFGYVPPGTYMLSGRALAAGTTVAASPEPVPLVTDEATFTYASVLLTPCAPACPD